MANKKADSSRHRADRPTFVEMPNGLFTSSGVWFHTTKADLEAFAGAVLERVELGKLLEASASWLRSPGTLALWVALLGLMTRSVPVAMLLGLLGFVGWSILSPGLVLRPLVRLAGWLEHPLLVGGAYVVGLSRSASLDSFAAVAAGLLWFILVRWSVLERLLAPVLEPIRRRLYRLGPADQILRALLVRHALALRLPVGDLEDMERRMMNIANRHRKK